MKAFETSTTSRNLGNVKQSRSVDASCSNVGNGREVVGSLHNSCDDQAVGKSIAEREVGREGSLATDFLDVLDRLRDRCVETADVNDRVCY